MVGFGVRVDRTADLRYPQRNYRSYGTASTPAENQAI
jgi:hypothetical protein